MDMKDRLGDTLRCKAQVEENLYFARQRGRAAVESAADASTVEAVPVVGRCPRCHVRLQPAEIGALQAHRCPQCSGLWLDRAGVHPFPVPRHEDWITHIERFYTGAPHPPE